MNTALGRLILVGRDTASAAGALTDYHRCIAKLEERARKLPVHTQDKFLGASCVETAMDLESVKHLLGQVLAKLDIITARVDGERKRAIRNFVAKRRAERGQP